MSEKIIQNAIESYSVVKKPKKVCKSYYIKKAPVKYEMPEQKGVCGMVANPGAHIPPKNKK